MGLLPEGLELVKAKREPIEVRITQASASGPTFTVLVNPLSVEKFKRLLSSNSLPSGVRAGSKAAREFANQFDMKYCKAAIAGWSGLTVDNMESILAGDERLSGDEIDEWRKDGREVEHSADLAVYLHQNSWAERFSNPIFAALQGGEVEEEEDDE